MRDLVLAGIIFGAVPFIIRRPWIGCLLYAWISVMNPHRLTWGFAYGFGWAQLVAVVTLIGLLVSTDKKRFPISGVSIMLVLFVVWMNITTLFAIDFKGSLPMWDRVMKNMLMIFVTLLVFRERKHIEMLIWVLFVSIGYFSIKGGFFTLMTGGQWRVYGPPEGVINENNSLAIATLMMVPLMRYLHLQATNKWVRRGLLVAMLSSFISALGSQSRGALLTVFTASVFFWFKSRHKFILGILIGCAVAGGVAFMSDQWEERMRTLKTYQEDESAQGRLHAWETMLNVAKDRPLLGAGFKADGAVIYTLYSADPTKPWTPVAHSIYFQVLGEHGFAGLAIFLLMLWLMWRTARWLMKRCRGRPELKWAYDLGAMIQVSLIAYGVGGAFLNLAHFELPYYMAVMLIVAREIVIRELGSEARPKVTVGSRRMTPAPVRSAP